MQTKMKNFADAADRRVMTVFALALVAGFVGAAQAADVAKIEGTSVVYPSLQEAVTAAADGKTVTLLTDVTTDAAVSNHLDRSIAINLGGHTVTRSKVSCDAKNRGAALEVLAGSVTVTNGTIKSESVYADVILARNDAALVIDDLSVQVGAVTGSCVYAMGSSTVTIRGGSFKNQVEDRGGDLAMSPSMMCVNTNSTGTVTVEAGKFYGTCPAAYMAEGKLAFFTGTAADASQFNYWEVKSGSAAVLNGSTAFDALDTAVAFAKAGDRLDVCANLTAESTIAVDKSVAINLGKYTLTRTNAGWDETTRAAAFDVTAGSVTITNGYVNCESVKADAILVRDGAALTLGDLSVELESRDGSCLYALGESTVTVNGGSYKNQPENQGGSSVGSNPTWMCVNTNSSGTVTVSAGKFYGMNPALGGEHQSTYVADGKYAFFTGLKLSPDTFSYWEVKTGTPDIAIGNTAYLTLDAAVASARAGDRIDVNVDVTLDKTLVIGESIAINLGQHTLTRTNVDSTSANHGAAFDVTNGTVVVTNGYISCESIYADAIVTRNAAALTLDNLSIELDAVAGSCVYALGTSTVTVKGGSYKNQEERRSGSIESSQGRMCVNTNSTGTVTVSAGKFYGMNPALGGEHADTYLAADRYAYFKGLKTAPSSFSYWLVSTTEPNVSLDGTAYDTLAAALAAVPTTGEKMTIKLFIDVDEGAKILAGQNVVLDLGGHTLSYEAPESKIGTIANHGTLVISNGTVTANKQGIYNYGTLTIVDGTYNSVESTVVVMGNSVTTIEGGTFTATDNAVLSGQGKTENANANVTVNGGTFNGQIASSGYIACGVYACNSGVWNLNGGTFNITGGVGVLARAGTVNVNGATFNVTAPAAAGRIGDKSTAVAGAVVAYDASNPAYPGYVAATDKIQIDGITIGEGMLSNVGIYGEPTIVNKSTTTLEAPNGYRWNDDGQLVLADVVITYDAVNGQWGDGCGTTDIVTYINRGYEVPTPDPVRENYLFLGWYSSWTNNAQRIENGSNVIAYVAHTIYAKWQAVSIDPGEGGEAIVGESLDGGKAVLVTGPVLEDEVVKNPFADGNLVLPEHYGNDINSPFVTTVGKAAYKKRNYDDKLADAADRLRSITLSTYVTEIRDEAFYACTNVTNVVFAAARDYQTGEPATVVIGSRAFGGIAADTIVIPADVSVRLRAGAFASCPNLTNICIYGEVTGIAKGVFTGSGNGVDPITIRLSPTYATNVAFVAALTNGMNASKVIVSSDPLGQVTDLTAPVDAGAGKISFTFKVDITSPWGAVNADSVTLFYATDLANANFVGTGKYVLPDSVTGPDADGVYTAVFDDPFAALETDLGYYCITVGAER